MLLLPPAYEGGGASVQQRWALRPPALLLRLPRLAFLRLREKWSQPAERRPWLRPPVRLEDQKKKKKRVQGFRFNRFGCQDLFLCVYLQLGELFSWL